jgi:hypothetical protein
MPADCELFIGQFSRFSQYRGRDIGEPGHRDEIERTQVQILQQHWRVYLLALHLPLEPPQNMVTR